MIKLINKYKNIYIFIITLSLIGLISGHLYYEIQPSNLKNEIKEQLNIQESLSNRVNNLSKNLLSETKILIYSILIIPNIINIFNIFYKPFQTGFIFNLLSTYNNSFSFKYILIYHIPPLIISIIVTRISLTITLNIIKQLVIKDNQSKRILKNSLKKYLLLIIISILYEISIIILSPYINTYLMTII